MLSPCSTVVCFFAVSAAAFAASLTCLIASPMLSLPVSPIPFAGSVTVTLPVAGSIAASGPIKSFTLFATLYNWPPFTASVLPAATLPSATPVIFLLPALMPSFFTEGPPAMVKPSVFNVLSPAFTESTVKSFFKLNFGFFGSVLSTTKFCSPFATSTDFTALSATPFTASNWPLFTASFGLTPSATLLITLLFAFKPSLLM